MYSTSSLKSWRSWVKEVTPGGDRIGGHRWLSQSLKDRSRMEGSSTPSAHCTLTRIRISLRTFWLAPSVHTPRGFKGFTVYPCLFILQIRYIRNTTSRTLYQLCLHILVHRKYPRDVVCCVAYVGVIIIIAFILSKAILNRICRTIHTPFFAFCLHYLLNP